MPPKRPRIVPSQTNLSVQDVRDYSTPDGAAMANEEMRRLKMSLQEVQEQQAQAVTDQQAAIKQPVAPTTDTPEPPTPASTEYSWLISSHTNPSVRVNNGDTVRISGINGINVLQNGRNLTIQQARYIWNVQGDAGSSGIRSGGTLRIVGINGVRTTVAAGDPVGTLTVDRPLQVYQRSIVIGGPDTTGLDFFNDGNQRPTSHEHRVFFEVRDVGNGIRRISGWTYKDGGGGGGGVTDWNASDGTTTVNVGDGDTVNWTGTNGVTVTLNPVGNQFVIDRPLQIRQDGVAIGGQDTTTINFDNATPTKPVGYTDQAWHEITDDGTGQRTVKTWVAPSAGSYTWNIEASGTAGTAAVVSGATVKFTGLNGIVATRTNDDINLSFNGEYVPTDPTGDGVLLFGVLIFNNNDTDVASGTKLPYHYGVRKYVDIVHGWNLANPNNFEFQLLDINWDYPPSPQPQVLGLQYYRIGAFTMSGEVFGTRGYPNGAPGWSTVTDDMYEQQVIFRNIPHVFALDANTVRVHATMTLNKPTEMRFRYFLRRLG